ncbi:2-oxoisovalerate dehydrogenase E1 component [Ereboglobus sp. PH5-5]|uniref:alpha-ketoacid dehydrogenase subunit alpha/beta n=1 Tax=Ereboglobus sp. PH5-5 TaxID=2940529 RepID=UPI0024067C5E|nr:alpha-ketoacid dehydrogenase subunit alpha/beta [Ereboglobus sp. PH5-5]MDF9833155.1 2-oxoisovalerate dehydrogenase E1 component [Ereboglobus sp. PH5-5]
MASTTNFPAPPAILNERDLRAADFSAPVAEPSALQPFSPSALSSPALLRIYAWMQLARLTDNRILDLFRQGLIKGTVTGGQGHEGLVVPLALLADKTTDVISFTHRGLGGHLIWSQHLCTHLNQYFANSESPTQAREGNVHRGDPANRSLPMVSHLGAMASNVTGCTDAQRRAGKNAVGIAIFGEGASSTGDIHETLNLASLLNIPVLFVIENNRYAYSTPYEEECAPGAALWQRAAGYGIEGFALDGTNPELVAATLAAALEKVRATSRPMLVEASVVRLRGHAAYDTCDYYPPGESERIAAADPLPKFRARLAGAGHTAQLDAIDAELSAYLETCVKISLAVPRPASDAAPMQRDIFAPAAEPMPWKPAIELADNSPLTMAQAINAALRKILTERPESLILGQDIGTYGGPFKVTEHLLRDFGRPRVMNVPLAESACTGFTIGLALGGRRPIEEFQFADFSTEAVTQITQNAATYRFRSGAQVPLVLRFPCGGGITLGSFHSQELESLFTAFPGIKALYPSNPQDAFNAILAAYEDNNPVLVFEHKGLYRRGKSPIMWDSNYRDIWQPAHLRAGDFATFVSYGEMTHIAAEACDYLTAEYERNLDLFDLRCLAPLNLDSIRESLSRTHRLIVLHEGRRSHGFGAELVAQLTEELFFSLEAPPLRIASLDMPVPFAPELEHVFRPTKDSVIEKITAWMG